MTTKLKVAGLQERDWGQQIARIHKDDRGSKPRWKICKITVGSKSAKFIVLGTDERGQIQLDIDGRERLGLKKGEERDFEFANVCWVGRVLWYLWHDHPTVHVPAWLALISIFLGIIGVVLGLISLCR